MKLKSASVAAILMVVAAYACAHAEDAQQKGTLSAEERAAVGAILDSLTTETGDALKSHIIREIDTLTTSGRSVDVVVSAVKIAAGPNLHVFQDILVSACLTREGRIYCRLAALPGPQQDSSPIQTTSTGGDGGGGGGGLGGGAQINQGHNSGSPASSPGSIFSTDPSQLFTYDNKFSYAPVIYTTYIVETSSGPGLSAPGPVAGAGLPSLLGFGALIFLRYRRGRTAERTH